MSLFSCSLKLNKLIIVATKALKFYISKYNFTFIYKILIQVYVLIEYGMAAVRKVPQALLCPDWSELESCQHEHLCKRL